MGHRLRRWQGATAAVAVAALLAVTPAQAVTTAQAVSAPGDSSRSFAKAKDKQITLITGDTVILSGGDAKKASIKPGAGREGMSFRTYRIKQGLTIIPADVGSEVASGRLDRRLFDITGLILDGYDDAAMPVIPLLVKYDGKGRRAPMAGATITRELPIVNGAAVRVAKKDAAGFASRLTAARSVGISRILLDGKRKQVLDKSVPQIGAPTAWQAGYTGKGTTVAVLDGGVEATHPDLVGQVTDAKNFSQSEPGDTDGHGTHVASTIAGTGAASGGKYKGVAPDAKIVDGKVCEDGGFCFDTAILGGMEWAAKEKKADVVNLSLGGTDTPELDPLEEAVNRLTAETGTLFVIAAGNAGPTASSVGSPGSADAALTVGAVDSADEIAEFSSRGPRVGDGAIKPEVTAPGVDIVAAKSKRAWIGEPVGEHYLRLSGTSMATPHVAGAAALLAQQHANWQAGDLKAALMASAKAHPAQSAFDQGAGRVDLTKAIKVSVVTDQGALGFGRAVWPHDDDAPVTKQLTYRNHGGTALTLSLQASLTGPDGQPAPAGAISLSATSVTVPAGGTASVQVTSNTKHNGADGNYFGRVVATSGDVVVGTPVGLLKEVESYDLTVRHILPDGQPAAQFASTLAFGLNEFIAEFASPERPTLRLPKGTYVLDGMVSVDRGNDVFDTSHLVQPTLTLDRDQTVSMDARLAKPVTTIVPRADAALAVLNAGYTRFEPGGLGLSSAALHFGNGALSTASIGSTAPEGRLIRYVASQWAKPGADGRFTNSPYSYHLAKGEPSDRYWTGYSRKVDERQLATLVDQHYRAGSDRKAEKTMFGWTEGMGGSLSLVYNYDLPSATMQYVETGAVEWESQLDEVVDVPGSPFPEAVVSMGRIGSYQAGRTYRATWNAATIGPSFGPGAAAFRDAEGLMVGLYGFDDAGAPVGVSAVDQAGTKLSLDGKVVGESDEFGYVSAENLPAAKGRYTLESYADRSKISSLSTRIEAEWQFSSQAVTERTALPLRTVRFQPLVDNQNRAARQPVTVLPFKLDAQAGLQLGKPSKVELQMSGDDGKTWRRAAVVRTADGSYRAIFATPKAAAYVSVKAKVVDVDGTLDQTVIRAYALR